MGAGRHTIRLTSVILGNIIMGVIAGGTSFGFALILGASPWLAIFVYSLVGSGTIVTMAFVKFAAREVKSQSIPGQTLAQPDVVNTAVVTAEVAVEVSKAVPQTGDGTMRILAVDDDSFIQELIPKIAATFGFPEVVIARSGAQALDIIDRAAIPFDCLLLDINMPGMDGIELCGRVRRLTDYQDIPIIMLSAVTELDALERAFRAGASDYTFKPFDIKDFGARLQRAQAQTVKWLEGVRPGIGDAVGYGSDRLTDLLAPVAGVTALIGLSALQNYLLSLRRSDLSRTYVMAVVAETTNHAVAMIEMLPQIATAIDGACQIQGLPGQGFVMAYGGNGKFLIVMNSEKVPSYMDIEAAIQDRLDAQSQASVGKVSPNLLISVGVSVRPSSNKTGRARIAFANASRLAQDRADRKKRALGIDALRQSRL